MLEQQRPKVVGGRIRFGTAGARLALPLPSAFTPLSERRSQPKQKRARFLFPDIVLGLLAGAMVLVALWLLMGR
jgi:hypothetical protein